MWLEGGKYIYICFFVPAATAFKESCSFDGQCSTFLANSVCLNETCTCATNQHEYGVRCVPSKRAGEYCTEDLECIYEPKLTNNAKCDHASCVCIYGKASDGTCNLEKDNNNSIKTNYSLQLLNIAIIFLLLTHLWY